MNRCFIVFLLVLTVGIVDAAEGWSNALRPAGKAVKVNLAAGDRSLYRLESHSGDLKAADFLIKGYRLLTNTDISAGNADKKIILYDDSKSSEAYTIDVDGQGNIKITGNVHNGVMALLEEDWGLRFYNCTAGTVTPGGRINSAYVVPRQVKPAFSWRSAYTFHALKPEFEYANRGHLGKFAIGFVHTIFKLLPPEQFYGKHPEFYALVNGVRINKWQDGQICTTNEKSVDIIAEKIIDFLDKNPDVEYCPVSQNDADGYCQCSECSKVIAEEGAPSGAMLRFVNKVAGKVGKKHPQVLIVTEAYRYTLEPPKITRPAENVVVRLCLNSRIAGTPFHYVDETDDREVIEKWRKHTDRLLVWDYMTNFRNYLLPRADMPVLEHNLRYYQKLGVQGVLFQSNYTNELGTLAGLRSWVVTKLLWNPAWNIRDLAMDYIYGYYKQAAPAMEKYYDLLNEQYLNYHSKAKPGNTFVFSRDFYSRSSALLEEAAKQVADDAVLSRELALELLTVNYYKLYCGPTDEKETASYMALLNQVKKEFIRLNIDHIMEGGYGKAIVQLEQFADRPKLCKYISSLPAGCIVLASSGNVYFGKSKVEDKKSLLGYVSSQKNNGAWDMQFRFEDFPQLTPGRYRVEVLLRSPQRAAGQTGVIVGVYNNKRKGYALNKVIPAAVVPHNDYAYINCGDVEFNGESMFLYTSVPANSALKLLYIDAVKLTPVSADVSR